MTAQVVVPVRPCVVKYVCDGCPHLVTKDWKDYLDNDETDSGTRATCAKLDRQIDVYWHSQQKAPDWCPLPEPTPAAPPPSPTWTTTRPGVAGAYWYRTGSDQSLAEVYADGNGWLWVNAGGKHRRLENFATGLEWLGPLHPAPTSSPGAVVTTVDPGALQMALNVLRRAGKNEVADALEATAVRGDAGVPHPAAGGEAVACQFRFSVDGDLEWAFCGAHRIDELRELGAEVCPLYTTPQPVPASSAGREGDEVAKLRSVIERIKLRLHFCGMPQEDMRPVGEVGATRWVPDWRYEISLIENALHGTPARESKRPDDVKHRHELPPPTPEAASAGREGASAEEIEWLEYAIAHMHDDSEPEDKTCASVLQALRDRLVANESPTPEVRERVEALDVDALAQEIRRVDGNHHLGAGMLAEALMPYLRRALTTGAGES